MSKYLFTLILGLAILAMQPLAAHGEILKRANSAVYSLRGYLVDIHYGHRMITVQEEFSKLERTFYAPWGKIDQLKVGDEIRVYFRHGRREAFSVQKMTPLEYRREDQNKGYLLRSEPKQD